MFAQEDERSGGSLMRAWLEGFLLGISRRRESIICSCKIVENDGDG
jgi:hypothetical protein